MLDHLIVVLVQTGVKLVPQSSHNGGSSKSVALDLTDIVYVDTSQGYHFFVDDAGLVSLSDFFRSIVGMIVLFGNGVEHWTQEQI